MPDFQDAKDSVAQLVERFDSGKDRFRNPNYNETQVRVEFINPMFRALGWDVENSLQVVHEDRVAVQDGEKKRVKHPDYGFRVGSDIRFYVEAKKPAVNLQDDPDPAYQVRRYGWSKKLPLSVLTDFEELIIYNCLQKPDVSDGAHIARLDYLTYEQYAERWEDVYGLFSYEAVQDGALDRFVEERKPRGTVTVDTAFLQEMERWRGVLAQDIAQRNPGLTRRQLNIAVQRTIDRLVFLRIAEDRNIEPYFRLGGAAAEGRTQVYRELTGLYTQANDKYNSGLFHFSDDPDDEVGDPVSLHINVGDEALRSIIGSLYYPNSPYEFSVLPADILGQVYERFLGSVIVLEDGSARIEEKPEVRKAGGVYYTPTYIVDYIVENTVGKLLEGKNPNQVAELRILDPACGSGSFLIGAYQFLLDWHLAYYTERLTENPNSTYGSRVRETGDPAQPYALTTAEKKRILLNNIYGVDLDQQAVEVTKLSLLLKMLEKESEATASQSAMFGVGERLLPDLASNIKWGNSLIGSDFYAGKQIPMFDDEEIYRVKAFDWDSPEGFGAIMRSGGFDAVIGNPPWGGDIDKELSYFHSRYPDSTREHTDSFKLFIDLALHLVPNEAIVSLIVPNVIIRQRRQQDIRELLLRYHVIEVVDLGEDVFADVTTPSCIFVVSKRPALHQHTRILDVSHLDNNDKKETALVLNTGFVTVPQERFSDNKDKELSPPLVISHNEFIVRLGQLHDLVCKDAGINYQRVGVGMQEKGRSDLSARLLYEGPQQKSEDRMFWKGTDIDRYWISGQTERWCRPYFNDFIKDNEVVRLNEDVYDAVPKILLRQTADNIRAVVDYRGVWFGRSIIAIVPSSNVSQKTRIEYYLGLLNSGYIRYLYQELTHEEGRVFAQVKLSKLKQLPIRNVNFDTPAEVSQHDKIVELVQTMLDLHMQLPDASGPQKRLIEQQIARTDREIDTLVYELYGLTEEEIAIVEGSV